MYQSNGARFGRMSKEPAEENSETPRLRSFGEFFGRASKEPAPARRSKNVAASSKEMPGRSSKGGGASLVTRPRPSLSIKDMTGGRGERFLKC